MNVFATLKTVFFGSKFLSNPVSTDGTPHRDLASAEARLAAYGLINLDEFDKLSASKMPQPGERVHTAKGNVYRVVECV